MKTMLNHVKAALVLAALLTIFTVDFAWAQNKPGWQQKWDRAVAQAKKEGKVVVLGPPGDRIREAISQGFSKAFPDISLEFSGARGGELATKVKAERDAGIYSVDIVINGSSTANAYSSP